MEEPGQQIKLSDLAGELGISRQTLSPAISAILKNHFLSKNFIIILKTKEKLNENSRNKARDLHDIYHLLKIQTKIEVDVVNKKLGYYDLSFDRLSFLNHCKNLKKNWNNELKSLMETVMPFDEIFSYVKDSTKQVNG